jgi:hypothetical protein
MTALDNTCLMPKTAVQYLNVVCMLFIWLFQDTVSTDGGSNTPKTSADFYETTLCNIPEDCPSSAEETDKDMAVRFFVL